MKRIAWLAALLLLSAIAAGAAEPDGFRDLRWGQSPPKGWRLTPRGENLVRAERARGATLGSARLDEAIYEFSGDRLVGVALLAKDRAGFLVLKRETEALFQAPGLPVPMSPASEAYHWSGQVASADLCYLADGALAVLLLSPVQGAGPTTAEERFLQNRLRLCAHWADRLDQSVRELESRAAESGWTPDAQQATTEGCRTMNFNAGRAQEHLQQRDSLTQIQAASEARGQVQKEMEQIRASLESVRRAKAAPAAPPVAP